MAAAPQQAKITALRSSERGHNDMGWLNTYHTFSFADYYNPKKERNQWSSLRVINEDRVAPLEGFPTHPHRDFEIYSYVLSGSMKHQDSMGYVWQKKNLISNLTQQLRNVEILHRGDIQFTSAGTGIAHSEYNASNKEPLHFLQVKKKMNVWFFLFCSPH